MLQLQGTAFTTGVLNYRDESDAVQRPHASIYIPVNFLLAGGQTISILALVDTGAPCVVLGPEYIDALGLTPAPGTQMTMETRMGAIAGFMDTIDVVIPAEEGDSLQLEVTVFACPNWNQGVFLGYSGCMARMNFAVQPQTNQFFFGALT